MSWSLFFYRRVGQPELTLEEVDAVVGRMPHVSRVPPAEEEPEGSPVRFVYRNPTSGVTFTYWFQPPPQDEEEDPGRADFPYEETPLGLAVDYMQSPELAQEAMPTVAEVCQRLDLLVLDPQQEQEIPTRPDVDALIRSYIQQDSDVQETIAYLRQRTRRQLAIGAALFLAGLILLVVQFMVRR